MAAPTVSVSADPPQLHGPYALWTRKADNKTVTRRLAEPELSQYRPWFENAKRLRALAAELQALTLGMVRTPPQQPSDRPRPARSEGPLQPRSTRAK